MTVRILVGDCAHRRFDDYREATYPVNGVYHDLLRCTDCGDWRVHLTTQRPAHFHFYCVPHSA